MGTKRARRKLLAREPKLRARGLLDMDYRPSELARELGIDKQMIYRRLIPAGMPHRKDERGNIWLHGLSVAEWVIELSAPSAPKMAQDEAYCLGCRKPVKLISPERFQSARNVMLKAKCPECDSIVNRGVKST